MELQSQYATLQQQGLELAVVTYDTPEVQRAYVERQGLEFPMLSDTGSEVIRRYGLLNETVDPTSRAYGIPHPGTFVLDTDGRVVQRFFEQGYQPRNTVASIIVDLGNSVSEQSGELLTTDHLEVLAYTTDRIVAPGNRFSVVLDVEPKPGMHVYAPGSHDYQVIRFEIADNAGLEVHPTVYPESEIYHFVPLDERVEVFQDSFRLIRDLTVPITSEMRERAAAADATLTIEGVIAYQACDDRICYNPVQLPVSWTLQLRPLVTD